MPPIDPRDRLIVALDLPSVCAAQAMVERLGDAVSFYKIGMELTYGGGLGLARDLAKAGKKVFLDLKLHDIPNTVARATEQVADLGATFLTIHAYPQTMRAAHGALAGSSMQLLAVTVMTSYDDADLHEAVVSRASLPPDLLNEMYFVVESRLRDSILARNSAMDPAALEAALHAGRNRLAERDGILPEDFADAEAQVLQMLKAKTILPETLAAWLRDRKFTQFTVALAEMSDIDFHTARKILEKKDLDALAIVCRAAEFEPRLFLTFAVLIQDKDVNAIGRAREYGALYAAVTTEAAMRTIRFWRMRRRTGDVAAA